MDRIIAGLLLGLAFLVMASVFVPGSIHADNSGPGALRPRTIEQAPPEPSISDERFDIALGSIESVQFTAFIIGIEDETRFTVVDNETGTVLGERLTADLVRQLFPELSIDDMISKPEQLLMTAEQLD